MATLLGSTRRNCNGVSVAGLSPATEELRLMRATPTVGIVLGNDIRPAHFFSQYGGFSAMGKAMESDSTRVAGFPLTRYWLIPQTLQSKVYMSHPLMFGEEIRERSQEVWDRFYSLQSIWQRSKCVKSLHSRLAFVLSQTLPADVRQH